MKYSKFVAVLLAVAVMLEVAQPVSADMLWSNEAENPYVQRMFSVVRAVIGGIVGFFFGGFVGAALGAGFMAFVSPGCLHYDPRISY